MQFLIFFSLNAINGIEFQCIITSKPYSSSRLRYYTYYTTTILLSDIVTIIMYYYGIGIVLNLCDVHEPNRRFRNEMARPRREEEMAAAG